MISSYLIDYVIDDEKFLFYDTVIDGKHVYTACGIGRVNALGNDAELSDIGRDTLAALHAYIEDLDLPLATIRFAEVRTEKTAVLRVNKMLEAANNKEVVFFVARSSAVYDATIAALNVSWVGHSTLQ